MHDALYGPCMDKVWRMDVRNRERREAWEVVAQLPGKIAFAGLASLQTPSAAPAD